MKFRVVIDTNVIVSHLLFPGGNPSKILDLAAADKLTLLLSDEILDEAGKVLREKFGFDSRRAGGIAEFAFSHRGDSEAPPCGRCDQGR